MSRKKKCFTTNDISNNKIQQITTDSAILRSEKKENPWVVLLCICLESYCKFNHCIFTSIGMLNISIACCEYSEHIIMKTIVQDVNKKVFFPVTQT